MANRVQSVDRAVEILDLLAASGDLGLAELSRRLDLSKSVVHRLLVSLREGDLVRQEPKTRVYTLGFKVLELAEACRNRFSLSAIAMPYLRQLNESTRQTVSLSVRDGIYRVAIAHLEGHNEIRFIVQIGRPLPLLLGAVGKILLAGMTDAEVDALFAGGLPAEHPPLPASFSLARLKEELKTIRAEKVALTHGERVIGSYAMATAIPDGTDRTAAALAILGASSSLSEEECARFRHLLLDAADRIACDWRPVTVALTRQAASEVELAATNRLRKMSRGSGTVGES
jgi:DNA-binding IclR family transcriptional regulator